MKKLKYITIISSFLGIVFCIACDKIPEDEYLIPVDAPEISGQKVLLEDYTGQRCSTCPPASKMLADLKELYKDNLITVAIHATSLAMPVPSQGYTNEFRTPEGTAWASQFGITQIPKGMVNRDSANVWEYGQWASAINKELAKTPDIELNIQTLTFDATTKKVTAKIVATVVKEVIDYDVKINAMILEDSIIGKQANSNSAYGTVPAIDDYVFMHVLRKVGYGTWGKSFISASDNKKFGTEVVESIEVTLADEWIPKNCHLVVYVSTDEPNKTGKNYRIVQAAEKSILENNK